MRCVEYRQAIEGELRRNPAGLTWAELRGRLRLPYDTACPAWTKRMEEEIGLSRVKGPGRALVWVIPRRQAGRTQRRRTGRGQEVAR